MILGYLAVDKEQTGTVLIGLGQFIKIMKMKLGFEKYTII